MTQPSSEPDTVEPDDRCPNGCDGPCICDHPDDCRCGCADDHVQDDDLDDVDERCDDLDCLDCYPDHPCADSCECAWCTGEAFAVPRILTLQPHPAYL
jgi:hypothetical protein